MRRMTRDRPREMRRGEKTHHQLQSMTPMSLRTRKITKRTPPRLRPDELLLLLDIYLLF
jgi:hypothetical protein